LGWRHQREYLLTVFVLGTMAGMDEQEKVSQRLTNLNIKAYYLLVALAFGASRLTDEHHQPPRCVIWSLKIALMLTAFVAVAPLQDFFKSRSWFAEWLEIVRWQKVLFLWAAFLFTLVWIAKGL
jgi:hypothetical protein